MACVQCSGSREGPTSATAGRVQGVGRSSSAASLFAKSCKQKVGKHQGMALLMQLRVLSVAVR